MGCWKSLQRADVATDGGVAIRLHAPPGAERLPAFVYFHGGGWTSGSLDGSDELCRTIAEATECAVASVDYRLAPAYRFPAAVEDSYAATCWLWRHGAELGLDPSRLAVGGTSAGANLATVVARLARDEHRPPLVLQLLVYPPTDHAAVADVPGAVFTRAEMSWHWSQYLRDAADGDDPRASPLRAADLSGLPPALVITAERDPLTDEAEEYARRLADAGVRVDVRRFDRAQHGFFSSATVQGRAARSAATAALREAFGS